MSTVATILCGRCAVERRREPGRLGVVTRDEGILVWRSHDPRWSKAARKLSGDPGPRDVRTLAHPGVSNLTVPGRLRVFCRTHGPGSVATADVLAASGSMTVTFTATG